MTILVTDENQAIQPDTWSPKPVLNRTVSLERGPYLYNPGGLARVEDSGEPIQEDLGAMGPQYGNVVSRNTKIISAQPTRGLGEVATILDSGNEYTPNRYHGNIQRFVDSTSVQAQSGLRSFGQDEAPKPGLIARLRRRWVAWKMRHGG